MEAKWYVYELVDPRDNSVFYVGKGSGNRIDAHEYEARKGVCSYKCNKIRQLWLENLTVLKRKVAYFWDEKAAYQHEAERIAQYPDLTNVVIGPACYFVGPPQMVKVKEKPTGWAAVSIDTATEFLTARPDILAAFFRFTKGKRGKIGVTIGGMHPIWKKVMETWYSIAFNDMYPNCLDKVIDSPTNWKKVQDALIPYGVILENGCTNKANAIV